MDEKLSPSRLEAFSDGVIAVIITIMVLELKVPSKDVSNMAGLRDDLALLFVYLLSFIQTGIYWVNHHYLIDDVEQVSHGILWANLALLFTLSLIPWATNWVAIRGISSFSVALYCIVCQLPAFAWFILSALICRRSGKPPAGSAGLQIFSAMLYTGAVPMSYVSPYIALGMITIVAFRWLMPPKKIIDLTRPAHPPHTPDAHSR